MEKFKTKKRFFKYGYKTGFLKPGLLNKISDVNGVTVGHETKIIRQNIRTGVTIINPGIKNLYKNKIPAAFYSGNGYGKISGTVQIEELGTLEAPIALTNTLSVGQVMRGVIELTLSSEKIEKFQSINVCVGECNDGFLNDIQNKSITENDVVLANKNSNKNFEVGNVGAGCGTRCFAWKGGIGTASRLLSINGKQYTLGTLVQTNYGEL